MEPELYRPSRPIPPTESWLRRAWTALVVERRLPYRLSLDIDRFCNAVGLRHKNVSVQGFTLTLRRLTTDESIVRRVIGESEYNPPGFEIRETDTVIDIGGHIGSFAIPAARRASRGRVLVFEPTADNYRLLKKNISQNGLTNIIPRHAAVSDRRGRAKVYLHPANTGGHSLFGDPARHNHEEVDTLTLEDIFTEYDVQRCDFLKLDCQGAEWQIFYCLPDKLFRRIDTIAMEYHAISFHEKRGQANQLIELLQARGYRIDAYSDTIGCTTGLIRARRLTL